MEAAGLLFEVRLGGSLLGDAMRDDVRRAEAEAQSCAIGKCRDFFGVKKSGCLRQPALRAT